jgi:glycerol-3-phosphate dehydrogenase subunit C
MREGSLDAPMRRPILWREPDFCDPVKLDAELRRSFDICHVCRRCFNLCDSFPRLFDLIDESKTGELDSVDSKDFKPVVDACTLCDMCFMTKCPYVPPHEFDLDIPHLMLRYRAAEWKQGKTSFADRQLTETDRNGKLGCGAHSLVNWVTKRSNKLTRKALEATVSVDQNAYLPPYASKPLYKQAAKDKPPVNAEAPAFGRKALIYATCYGNYNNPDIGLAARAVLARNGVETEVVYPECCGMPQLEHGDIERVAGKARRIAASMAEWIDKGWDVVALVPSCALMVKFEWPLIEPGDEAVLRLARSTFDITEYVVDIAKKEGLAEGLKPLDGKVAMHIACHARAQNMGQKGAELLRLIPGAEISVMERCSGHGGAWGVKKDNFETALKVGKPVARQIGDCGASYVVSECPLAREHIVQGVEAQGKDVSGLKPMEHPIQVLAYAYGL